MATVNKEIADDIIAGKYPEDHAIKIVKYTNAWDGESYGVIFKGERLNAYQKSDFVRNPEVYWEAK